MKNYIFVVLLFATLSLLSCNNEFDNVIENEIADSIPEVVDNSASTRALSTSTFNWETITTMPTAPGQGTIGVPWVGNGALTALYDLDWVSDRHASDGWVMLGHCFGSEYNYPYFILYNIYRGLLRVYLYVYSNGASAFSSTNMKDGVFLNSSSGYTSTVLNFLGRDLIDVTEIPQSYSQIQPASSFLDSPFMTGQW